jgi:hypothetical protein
VKIVGHGTHPLQSDFAMLERNSVGSSGISGEFFTCHARAEPFAERRRFTRLCRASMLQRRNRARLKTRSERYRRMDCRIKFGNDDVNAATSGNPRPK